MALWGWIAIGAGGVLIAAAMVIAAIYGWRELERRYLLRLVTRREAIDAVRLALEDTVSRLAQGSDEMLSLFAADTDAQERRSLHEVTSRARILADELDMMALPKKLIPAADALADTAFAIGREAGKVHDDCLGDSAFDALGSIDLSSVSALYAAASLEVQRVCEVCGLQDDAAVYGGGLYL